MNNQDIELKKLEELVEKYDDALGKTKDEIQRVKLIAEILKVEAIIEAEKNFRNDRDELLKGIEPDGSDGLIAFRNAKLNWEDLIKYLDEPAVVDVPDAYDDLMKQLKEQYKLMTGKDLPVNPKTGNIDMDAAKDNVEHISEKREFELDALYGNVDQDSLEYDMNMLKMDGEEYSRLEERQEDYANGRKMLNDLKGMSRSDIAEVKKKVEELQKAKAILKKLEAELNDILAKIAEIDEKIVQKENEVAELEAINPRTKEQEEKLNALKKEMGTLKSEKAKYEPQRVAKEAAVDAARAKVASLEFAPGSPEAKYQTVAGLFTKLGVMDGDKSYKLTENLDEAAKKLNKASRAEKITSKKKEIKERSYSILDKYGVAMTTLPRGYNSEKLMEALENRVKEVKHNYNPAHIQPGYEDNTKKKEAEKEELNSHTEEGNEKGGANPGGSRGTETSRTGTFAGPTSSERNVAPGGNGSNLGVNGTDETTRTSATGEVVDSEKIKEERAKRQWPYGEIVEEFDGSVDFKALCAEPGRCKIENGYVYRVADIGPADEGDGRVYGQVKEKVEWYLENTDRKIKYEINQFVDNLKEMKPAERRAIMDKLPKSQRTLVSRMVNLGIGMRLISGRQLMNELKKEDMQTKVSLLAAYKAANGNPEMIAEATARLRGNPYEHKSDLIITQTKEGSLFRKSKYEVVKTAEQESDLVRKYSENRSMSDEEKEGRTSRRTKNKTRNADKDR